MRLKALMTAAATAVLAMSGSAWADTDTAGYVGAQYVYTNVDDDFGDDSTDTGVIEGVVSLPLSGNFGAEVESAYAFTDSDGSNDDVWTIAGHAFHRTAAGLIGGFVAATTNDDDTAWTVGAEGDYYTANGTLGAQVSYTSNDDANVDVWAGFAHYRHYVMDDWYLQASAGLGNAEFDGPGSSDADFWTVGAATEYRFASSPFSVNAGVDYISADDVDATAVTVGLRYNFDNDGSLRRRDTNGPSLRARIPAILSSSSGSSGYTPPPSSGT